MFIQAKVTHNLVNLLNTRYILDLQSNEMYLSAFQISTTHYVPFSNHAASKITDLTVKASADESHNVCIGTF